MALKPSGLSFSVLWLFQTLIILKVRQLFRESRYDAWTIYGHRITMECVRCGATAVIEGALLETGGGGGVAFLPKGLAYLKRIFGGSRKILAHACLHCSHLELTVEFTENDRKLYQEFDGPQPGVLDRIA